MKVENTRRPEIADFLKLHTDDLHRSIDESPIVSAIQEAAQSLQTEESFAKSQLAWLVHHCEMLIDASYRLGVELTHLEKAYEERLSPLKKDTKDEFLGCSCTIKSTEELLATLYVCDGSFKGLAYMSRVWLGRYGPQKLFLPDLTPRAAHQYFGFASSLLGKHQESVDWDRCSKTARSVFTCALTRIKNIEQPCLL